MFIFIFYFLSNHTFCHTNAHFKTVNFWTYFYIINSEAITKYLNYGMQSNTGQIRLEIHRITIKSKFLIFFIELSHIFSVYSGLLFLAKAIFPLKDTKKHKLNFPCHLFGLHIIFLLRCYIFLSMFNEVYLTSPLILIGFWTLD